jgi:thiol peroxidase
MANRPGMMVGEKEHPVQEAMLQIGQPAPDFKLLTNNRSERTLADYTGKIKIISTIPSIDTRVCSAQTKRFNEEAAHLDENIIVLTVSADTTFALRRYCDNEGIARTETLSTYMDMGFADAYGVHDTEWRVCQRGVFVLDKENTIRHAEYVPVLGQEINFEAALAAAKALV